MVARVKQKLRVVGAGTLLWCRCQRGPSGTVYDGWKDPQCLWDYKEVLYDGPAGTSKTFSDCARIHWACEKFPQIRVLILRETRQSLVESHMALFETHIIGLDHEILRHGGDRKNRTAYDYLNGPPDERGNPTKGAHIALGGIDRIDLHLSTEWDLFLLGEATNPRIREHHWNAIKHRMRAKGVPHPHCQYPDGIVTDGEFEGMSTADAMANTDRFVERKIRHPLTGRMFIARDGEDDYGTPLFWRQMVAECNPSMIEGAQHWLMKRWEAGEGIAKGGERTMPMARIISSHGDNPSIDADYLDGLRSLPEPYRSIYYEGKWVTAEGRCWPTYDPQRHLVRGEFNRDADTGHAYIVVADWKDASGNSKVFTVKAVTAGFDWGIGHAGSLQIFATTTCGRAFRICEFHHHDLGLEEWAKVVVELVDLYRIEAILCDPSARAVYDFFNAQLGSRRGRDLHGICQPADNTHATKDWVMGGLDLVRTLFAQDKLFLFEDCHHGPVDHKLKMKRAPIGLHEEIPAYVLARDPQNPDVFLPHPDKKRNPYDDACFVAGTLIATPAGARPIEDLQAGDVVLTHLGPRVVEAAGCTSRDAKVFDLQFDGGVLRGTGNHPVWSADRWVRLDSLRVGQPVHHLVESLVPVGVPGPPDPIIEERQVTAVRRMGRSAVFNLTVDDAHTYFANGVLVHNCDAVRYNLVDSFKLDRDMRPKIDLEYARNNRFSNRAMTGAQLEQIMAAEAAEHPEARHLRY